MSAQKAYHYLHTCQSPRARILTSGRSERHGYDINTIKTISGAAT